MGQVEAVREQFAFERQASVSVADTSHQVEVSSSAPRPQLQTMCPKYSIRHLNM